MSWQEDETLPRAVREALAPRESTAADPMTAQLHQGKMLRRRRAAIKKGHRTRIQTTFHEGEWRSTLWIDPRDEPGTDYVGVWRNGTAHVAYRVRRALGEAWPEQIPFGELP